MALRPLLVSAFLIAMALAGCSGGGDGDGESTTSTSTSGTSSGTPSSSSTTSSSGTSSSSSSSTSSGPANNQPPTATLSASIEQGSIPLNVTFDLSGSDADGDALTWTLDADGDTDADANGTSLPAAYNHTYSVGGLYNVTFTVSDGTAEIMQNLTINATAAAAAEGPVFTASGSYQTGSAGLCALGLAETGGSAGAESGVTYADIPFAGDLAGLPFTATFVFTLPSAGLIVAFPDDSGSFAGQVTNAPSPSPTTLSGVVPGGAVGAFLSSCGGAGVSVTLVVG